jgi:hypothetical protein
MNTTQIRKGSRVEVLKTGATGIATSDITFRTNAGRSRKQIMVSWDNGGEWNILVSNIKAI